MSFASNMVSTFRNNLALRKKVVFDPYRNKDAETLESGELEVKPLSPDLRAQIQAKAKTEDRGRHQISMVILAVVAVAVGVLCLFLSYIF